MGGCLGPSGNGRNDNDFCVELRAEQGILRGEGPDIKQGGDPLTEKIQGGGESPVECQKVQ